MNKRKEGLTAASITLVDIHKDTLDISVREDGVTKFTVREFDPDGACEEAARAILKPDQAKLIGNWLLKQLDELEKTGTK